MCYVIDGQALAKKIKDEIIKEIIGGRQGLSIYNSYRPNLAIILIGERDDSELYVNLKEKEAKRIGVDTHIYRCRENISEKEVLELIEFLNSDETIDAILVQLPLPVNFNTDKIIQAIDPKKDIDGFHPDNLKKLTKEFVITPPVFAAVLNILESIDYDLGSKKACVIANSEIFGKSLIKVLARQGARAEIVKIDDEALKEKTKEADVLITAVGRPHFIKKEMVKKDAIVIDIGITKKGKKVYGDVDFEDVKKVAGFITPVPGGVGPLTIAMALKNTLELYKRKYKDK